MIISFSVKGRGIKEIERDRLAAGSCCKLKVMEMKTG